MRSGVALLFLAGLTAPVAGQAAVRLSVGGTAGSVLLHDAVITDRDITVGPGAGPTLDAAVALPTGAGYRVILEGEFNRSPLHYTELAATSGLGSLTTITVVALLDGQLRRDIRWQIGGGRVAYHPSEQLGMFGGQNPSFWLFTAGGTWTYPLGRQLAFLATLRYDFHDFTTDALMAHDFQTSEGINRVSLFAGIERRF